MADPRVLVALCVLAGPAHAGALADGAEAFEAGELDRAIEVWQPAVDAGNPSGKLLFDLGNAWYRKGDLPRAIAHYRAAQRLRPRDGSIHHNLAVARSGLEPVPPAVGPVPAWIALLSAGELSLLGLVLTAGGTAGVVGWSRVRRRMLLFGSLTALLLGLVLSGAAFFGGRARVGVVVDQQVGVRDIPAPHGGVHHRLVPGTEVRIRDVVGDFFLVEDGDARSGWVPRNAVLAPGS